MNNDHSSQQNPQGHWSDGQGEMRRAFRPDTLHPSDGSMHNSNTYHSTSLSQPHTPGMNFGGHSQGMFMPHHASMPAYGSGPVGHPGYPPMAGQHMAQNEATRRHTKMNFDEFIRGDFGAASADALPPSKKVKTSTASTKITTGPKRKGRAVGATQYTIAELELLNRCVEKKLPYGQDGWTAVAEAYNLEAKANGRKERTWTALRERFDKSWKTPKPTGDADPEPYVTQALRIMKAIEGKSNVVHVDDHANEGGADARFREWLPNEDNFMHARERASPSADIIELLSDDDSIIDISSDDPVEVKPIIKSKRDMKPAIKVERDIKPVIKAEPDIKPDIKSKVKHDAKLPASRGNKPMSTKGNTVKTSRVAPTPRVKKDGDTVREALDKLTAAVGPESLAMTAYIQRQENNICSLETSVREKEKLITKLQTQLLDANRRTSDEARRADSATHEASTLRMLLNMCGSEGTTLAATLSAATAAASTASSSSTSGLNTITSASSAAVPAPVRSDQGLGSQYRQVSSPPVAGPGPTTSQIAADRLLALAVAAEDQPVWDTLEETDD